MSLMVWAVLGWLVRLVMTPLVARRHEPAHAIAWLAPVFLFPIPGALAYFWLGYFGLERSARKHRRVRESVETGAHLQKQEKNRAGESVSPQHRDLIRLADRMVSDRIGGYPILTGNTVDLLPSGEFMDALVETVDGAREHVHMLFYQYVDDADGRRLSEAMARAVSRGVTCRLLWDAWASRRADDPLGDTMRRQGIHVHAMLPVSRIRRPLSRIDVRNHRKIAVIDGVSAFTGSHNIHVAGHELQSGVWHQISARVRGPAALQLQTLFVEDWYFATDELLEGDDMFPDTPSFGDVAVQTIPGGPSYPAHILQHVLVQAIGEASESLIITTPYLIPDESILLALRLAALRGVEVDVLIPARSDRAVADAAARGYFSGLMSAGVRIHLHQDGVLHAKTLSIDSALALVGTANIDRRSLFLNYENVLLIFGEDCVARLRELQRGFMQHSERVDPESWERRPVMKQYLQHTAKLLSPLL